MRVVAVISSARNWIEQCWVFAISIPTYNFYIPENKIGYGVDLVADFVLMIYNSPRYPHTPLN